MALLLRRIHEKICAMKTNDVPGLTGPTEDIDISPDMRRFGDRPQSWYERSVQIGNFEIKTDPIQVNWDSCMTCYSFSSAMFVQENTGDNRLGATFRERSVRMGEWPLSGSGCCAR